MRLLFDQNISYKILKLLSPKFQSQHLSSVGLMNASDYNIWEFSKINNYAVVTFDQDFLNIALLKGTPPKIILLKGRNRTTQEIATLLNTEEKIILKFLEDKEFSFIACLEVFF